MFARDAARRALVGAAGWLANPTCQAIFSEFHNGRGVPLSEKLRELAPSPQSYLHMVFFLDGEQQPPCKRDGVLAFTTPGSRVVYLCAGSFERATRRNIREVQATIIHELLHSLGLRENPPSPRHITNRVQRLCWQ